MLKVGLTGGIGCGKSSAVTFFRDYGIPVIDADQIAREVVEPGEPALQQIVEQFGGDILDEAGDLDRAAIRQRVFADQAALQQLEAIIHPVIRDTIIARMHEAMTQSRGKPYVLVDVPLLFEKDYQSLFDRVIAVDCLPEQQIARVSQRDGSPEETIRGIMSKQVSREQRLALATDIIENTTTLTDLKQQVIELHNKFSAMNAS